MYSNTAMATSGSCPYCGESSLQKAPANRRREDEVAMQCSNVECLKYSTLTNGKVYPHDDPSDPHSTNAKLIRY